MVSSTNSLPAAMQFSPLLKNTELMPWNNTRIKLPSVRRHKKQTWDWRDAPCARPCPGHSHWRWGGEIFLQAPERLSSRYSLRSFTWQRKHWWTWAAEIKTWRNVTNLMSLTSSWCVYQLQWSQWSLIYEHVDDLTDADPPMRLRNSRCGFINMSVA